MFFHHSGQNISKKGVLHALAAFAYVATVVSFLTYLERSGGPGEDTYLAPVGFLLLLVLSVSVMGLLIFGAPILLYIDGKKKEAVQLVVWTIGSLAAITVCTLVVMMLMAR